MDLEINSNYCSPEVCLSFPTSIAPGCSWELPQSHHDPGWMAGSKGAGLEGAAAPSADSQSAKIMDFGRISGHTAGQEELTRGH